MIKTFVHNDLILRVKTNILKKGACYFGETDIKNELDYIYKNVVFNKEECASEEIFLLSIYKHLTSKGIKPYQLEIAGLVYEGTKMTDLDAQQQLEKQTE